MVRNSPAWASGRWMSFAKCKRCCNRPGPRSSTRRPAPPSAASLHVAAAVCLEEVLGELLTDFSLQDPGPSARCAVFGASDELADYVLAGAAVDLFLSAGPEPLHRLEAAGIAEPKSRTILAENVLAVIGPADCDTPMRTGADLARPGVNRIALADPTSPLGRYTRDYPEQPRPLRAFETAAAAFVDNSLAVGAAVRGPCRCRIGLWQ